MRSAPSPQKVGRYDLLLPIARGGMGMVYLARTLGLEGFERTFALKIVDGAAEPELARDLVDEAKLAARIHHRNVVAVLDVGIDSQVAYLAMEYVEGPSLARLLHEVAEAGGRLPIGVGMRIVLDTLEGLHAAHELRGEDGAALGIVHRDVSPANVLVGTDGIAKLADFGIARALSRSSRTSTGIVKGKFSYMSPEQARGTVLDRRADVWSAGIVAWEIVAGRKLYPLGNDPSTLLAVVSEDPPRLSSVVPHFPELDAAVGSALTRDASARCSSAIALASALEEACEAAGIEIATHTEVAETVRRWWSSDLAARRSLASAARERAASATLAPTVHDPGTFAPASELVVREPVANGRSRLTWAAVVLGAAVGLALAWSAIMHPFSPRDANRARDGAADPGAPPSTALGARPVPVDDVPVATRPTSTAPLDTPPPQVLDSGSSEVPALVLGATGSSTPPPLTTARPGAPAVRGPRLIERDPYTRGR